MAKSTAPYGTWTSPVTPEVILKSGSKVDELLADPITSTIYHIERRPAEAGRTVIVKTEIGEDVVGKEWNVRTGVHEYGGTPATAYDGIIYFSNLEDGRVYRLIAGQEPEAVTPENKNHRFAQLAVHPKKTHLLVAILEDHIKPQPADVVNTLVVIDTNEKTVSPLISGADFYSHPTFTPDGTHIAWQQWFHPDMSWEGCEIGVAEVRVDTASIKVVNTKPVAGRPLDVSATYPVWASNDLLLFVSDEHGYWNPWTYSVSSGKASAVLSKPVDEDFAEPGWRLGWRFGTPLDSEGKYALYTALREGRNVLYLISLRTGTLEELESPYVHINYVTRVTHDAVVFQGRRNDGEESTVLCNIKEYAKPKFTSIGPRANKDELPFDRAYVSVPQSFVLKDPETGEPSHVIYYPPTNPEFAAPDGEKPPAIFNVHGGPTSRTPQGLSYQRLFYTTRGWAWVDVNYGGSNGYGRKYSKRLEGRWGITDVRDTVVAVKQLSSEPYSLVDHQRTAVTGGSAGGYTVLKTLCSCPDAFAAGTSSYGISDFFKLAEFTHKFESQYLFKLVGGTPEQVPDVYKERSPVFLAGNIKAPLLVLQGSEDAVVPPNQAEGIVENIRKRGGRVEYTVFQGEGHGWRKEENIRAALEKELAFYEDVFGLRK
ncbi:alpha/beta-hydrolase [Dichomitus squalens]|uniref:Alpha/beta-hydrolase n=1 Tax=Dichomitus squalens TaxID=114155 RepID=A0A4V2K0W4_9APHY|nr:alpha/beta-hydrolase [Dichomitus squalens]